MKKENLTIGQMIVIKSNSTSHRFKIGQKLMIVSIYQYYTDILNNDSIMCENLETGTMNLVGLSDIKTI